MQNGDHPVRAIVWQNGMLMVFDQFGQQVPDYQGMANEKLQKLKSDWPECPVEYGVWS